MTAHELWIFSVNALLAGIGATLMMDIWAWLQFKLFSIASLDYALVGRWIGYFFKGKWRHQGMTKSPALFYERPLGWFAHYAIGVVFAAIVLWLLGASWRDENIFVPTMMIGIGSVVVPYFIMQPAFGLGLAGANLPHPWIARLKSLAAHTSFAIGLYISLSILKSF